MELKDLIAHFDRLSPYTDRMIERGIEEHRKGLFAVKVTDADKKPAAGVPVTVDLARHEFKFGCALFLLDQFPDAERSALYRKRFPEVFNYGVMPLYWDTLEPEKGHPRFAADSPNVYRRPALDLVRDYCRENRIGLKGHCLMYNSFNPKWMPRDFRSLKMAVEKRSREIAERYADDVLDLDVINEMFTVYRNAHGEYGMRDLPICDEEGHEKWCFDVAKKYFPYSRLFWNEGCYETFLHYTGDKSVYYLMLKRWLAAGAPIGGIGMQFHAFSSSDAAQSAVFNPYRQMDVFRLYSEFRLPIHLSEVSIPSHLCGKDDESAQAELVERLYRLWFSREFVDAAVWWNMVDGMAYGGESAFCAGLFRNDMTPKPAWEVLDRLVNKEWHTTVSLLTDKDGMAYFEGFYGDYDVTVSVPGAAPVREQRPFRRESTGYYHVTSGPMAQKFVIG